MADTTRLSRKRFLERQAALHASPPTVDQVYLCDRDQLRITLLLSYWLGLICLVSGGLAGYTESGELTLRYGIWFGLIVSTIAGLVFVLSWSDPWKLVIGIVAVIAGGMALGFILSSFMYSTWEHVARELMADKFYLKKSNRALLGTVFGGVVGGWIGFLIGQSRLIVWLAFFQESHIQPSQKALPSRLSPEIMGLVVGVVSITITFLTVASIDGQLKGYVCALFLGVALGGFSWTVGNVRRRFTGLITPPPPPPPDFD